MLGQMRVVTAAVVEHLLAAPTSLIANVPILPAIIQLILTALAGLIAAKPLVILALDKEVVLFLSWAYHSP